MDKGLISKRYAKALLEYATEREEDQALYERMKILQRSFSEVPSVRETFRSPLITRQDREELLYTAAGGDVEESYKAFVSLILDNQRELLAQNIAISYQALYRHAHHITIVNLISAEPLSDEILKKISRQVELRTHGPVEMESSVDAALKGGFIFQIDDLRMDASVATQLENIRRQFISKNKIIV